MASATARFLEDDVNYQVAYRSGEPPARLASKRELNGAERQAHQSRYSRGKVAASFGGAPHRRGKRSGL